MGEGLGESVDDAGIDGDASGLGLGDTSDGITGGSFEETLGESPGSILCISSGVSSGDGDIPCGVSMGAIFGAVRSSGGELPSGEYTVQPLNKNVTARRIVDNLQYNGFML